MPEEGIKIKRGKLRGIESCGMMCSIEELGSSREMYPDAPEEGTLPATGGELNAAIDAAYAAASQIHFQDMHFRTDIGRS